MKINTLHVSTERHNDSLVYRFKVLVDDVVIKYQNGVDEDEQPQIEDKIFSIQVQDGCCEKKAIREFLQKIKYGIEKCDDANPETPSIEI